MRLLAEKISAVAPKSASVTLEAKNISSLSAAESADVRAALELELARHNIRVISSSSASATAATGTTEEYPEIQLTLSEGADGYVWVAEIRRGNSGDLVSGKGETEMVSVPKAERTSGA